jgi:FSR family fosmidomycin resistance protein-like MFS transporter
MKRYLSSSLRLPLLLGLAHGVADGSAGLLLGHLPATHPGTQVALLVLIYNALAFGAQPLVGWLADRSGRSRACAGGGLLLLGLALLPIPFAGFEFAVFLAGIGSAAFHVGAGALTLRSCGGRSDGAGLFAAPGVVGLAIGGALAVSGYYPYAPFLIALLALFVAIVLWPKQRQPALNLTDSKEPIFESHDWIMIGLLTAIALRSLIWTAAQFASSGHVTALVALGVAAGIGKIAGGFLAQRLGYRRWTLLALTIATPLLAFGGKRLGYLLPGIALLQSTIPCSITAMARLMPTRPATATGLVLGLAVALGGLPPIFAASFSALSPILTLVVILAAAAGFWYTIAPRPRAL